MLTAERDARAPAEAKPTAAATAADGVPSIAPPELPAQPTFVSDAQPAPSSDPQPAVAPAGRFEPDADAAIASAASDAAPAKPTAKPRVPAPRVASAGGLLSDDELKAALAEIESKGDLARRAIPSLDEDRGELEAASPASIPPEAQPTAATRKAPRFRLGTAGEKPTAAAAPAPRTDGAAPPQDAAETPPPGDPTAFTAIYDALDRCLGLLHRPFDWVSPGARSVLGPAAAATLVITTAAVVLAPIVFPKRDALTFLAERRARVEAVMAERLARASQTREHAQSDGKPAKPAGAHGEKPAAKAGAARPAGHGSGH